jgi:hypothetical protein
MNRICHLVAAVALSACASGEAVHFDAVEGQGRFSIVVLPDTQLYSHSLPDIFDWQTRWIKERRELLNIQMVIHVGDLVEGSWEHEQWRSARSAMARLDGEVPYVISPGNHDYGAVKDERNAAVRTTHLHQYFPRHTFEKMPTFGGFYEYDDRVDNSYHTFTVDGQEWLVLALEFGPRPEVIEWADGVLRDHDNHFAIIATHAYLYADGSRYNWLERGEEQPANPHAYGIDAYADIADGEELWQGLVSKHSNIVAVLCGHEPDFGVAYQRSQGAGEVHELLANYQMQDYGGSGFLRVMEFDGRSGRIDVRTFSPWLGLFKEDSANQRELDFSSHF